MINDFNIINPKTDKNRPFFDKKRGLFVFKLPNNYKYYIEVSGLDKYGNVEYYFLLSKYVFDSNCRFCNKDDYGRFKIHVGEELKNYIDREFTERGNLNINFIESRDKYDIYKIE